MVHRGRQFSFFVQLAVRGWCEEKHTSVSSEKKTPSATNFLLLLIWAAMVGGKVVVDRAERCKAGGEKVHICRRNSILFLASFPSSFSPLPCVVSHCLFFEHGATPQAFTTFALLCWKDPRLKCGQHRPAQLLEPACQRCTLGASKLLTSSVRANVLIREFNSSSTRSHQKRRREEEGRGKSKSGRQRCYEC